MLQEECDGGTRAAVVAFFYAAWRSREAARRGDRQIAADELADLILTAVSCPWLDFCLPSGKRKERRALRARQAPPTIPEDSAAYRSDGACRDELRLTGWGAAYWARGRQGLGENDGQAWGHLGEGSTNNVAEYEGVRQALLRAVRSTPEPCIFEVDSLVVANQLLGIYGCRNPDLIPAYRECCTLLGCLTQRGQPWVLRHIYREYNATADSLATDGTSPELDKGAVQTSLTW